MNSQPYKTIFSAASDIRATINTWSTSLVVLFPVAIARVVNIIKKGGIVIAADKNNSLNISKFEYNSG